MLVSSTTYSEFVLSYFYAFLQCHGPSSKWTTPCYSHAWYYAASNSLHLDWLSSRCWFKPIALPSGCCHTSSVVPHIWLFKCTLTPQQIDNICIIISYYDIACKNSRKMATSTEYQIQKTCWKHFIVLGMQNCLNRSFMQARVFRSLRRSLISNVYFLISCRYSNIWRCQILPIDIKNWVTLFKQR